MFCQLVETSTFEININFIFWSQIKRNQKGREHAGGLEVLHCKENPFSLTVRNNKFQIDQIL